MRLLFVCQRTKSGQASFFLLTDFSDFRWSSLLMSTC